jgi:predicted HicB family RNase H-like nuclease
MAHRGRPREFDEDRVTKALRISPELDEKLKAVARERQVSVNLLINAAVEDYLDRLVPVREVVRAAH